MKLLGSAFIIASLAFALLFTLSLFKEPRRFRNCIYIVLIINTLLCGFYCINEDIFDIKIYFVVIFSVIMPFLAFIASALFILAGVIAVKREGKTLANALGIIVGLGFMLLTVNYILLGIGTVGKLNILFALLALPFIFTFFGLFIYSQIYLFMPKSVKKCKYIIVCGSGLIGGIKVPPLLAARIDTGAKVWLKTNKKAAIILSGGQGSDEKLPEGLAMKNYLIERGIPESCLRLEDKSKNTYENIKFSKRIIDREAPNCDKVIFVTNNYHVFRTGLFAKELGLKAGGVGCHTALYYRPGAFIREYIAILQHYKSYFIVFGVIWLAISLWISFRFF